MSQFLDKINDLNKKVGMEKINEIKSWQNVPIEVKDITPEICDICKEGKTHCRGWLNKMGLGKYCYESYKKYHNMEQS